MAILTTKATFDVLPYASSVVGVEANVNKHCGKCDCTEKECISEECSCTECLCDAHCKECEHHTSDGCYDNECWCNDCDCGGHCSSCEHYYGSDFCQDNNCHCDDCGCDYDDCEDDNDNDNNDVDYDNLNVAKWAALESDPRADQIIIGAKIKEVGPNSLAKLLGPPDLMVRLATFYCLSLLSLDVGPVAARASKAFKLEADDLARVFINYLTLACAGEARYATYIAPGHVSPLATSFTRNGARATRTELWTAAVVLLASGYTHRELLSATHELFALPWPNLRTCGGAKWAKCAATAIDYLDGKMSAVMFADTVVSLIHNGGLALNKGLSTGYYALEHICNGHQLDLSRLLAVKQEANNVQQITYRCCVNNDALKEVGYDVASS